MSKHEAGSFVWWIDYWGRGKKTFLNLLFDTVLELGKLSRTKADEKKWVNDRDYFLAWHWRRMVRIKVTLHVLDYYQNKKNYTKSRESLKRKHKRVSSSSSSHLWKMYLKINFWTIKQILFFSIFLTISCILELILFYRIWFWQLSKKWGRRRRKLIKWNARCWKNQKKEGLKKLPKEWKVKKVKKAEKCENEWLKRKREMDQINNAILWIQLGNNILRVKSFFFSLQSWDNAVLPDTGLSKKKIINWIVLKK